MKQSLAFILLFFYSAIALTDNIDIYIRDDVFNDYQRFIGDRNVLSVDDFSGQSIRRDVVDMIIAQQALALGGFKHKFIFYPGKINFRNTKMMQSGKLLLSFDSYWLTDAQALNSSLYISDPVIRNGEYIAGFYTSKNNQKALATTTLADFSQLTAVSTPRWKTDWQTLKSLPLKELIEENEWLSMARMVDKGWIDFIIMPFNSTPDQSFTLEKIHLVPIPKMALLLKDSRHFVISKKHPKANATLTAINLGLQKLRAKGAIVKAYTEAGFFVDRKGLTIINQNQ